MRRFVVAALVVWSSTSAADIPAGITKQVANFIFDGCDYIHAQQARSFKQEREQKANHKKLALHFGRVVSSHRRGIDVEYVVRAPTLPQWDVSYWIYGVDIRIPATVAITMGDLQYLLGRDATPSVDYALSVTRDNAAKIELAERDFEPPGHGGCRVAVQTEADEKKGPERRVFSLRFWQ